MRNLGLYLHIPFCRSKCAYCDFYSLAGHDGRMDEYCTALLREISRWGADVRDYEVDTVYFGGGTPSWFGAERIVRLLNAVKTSFLLSDDCEITLEANPDSVTPDGLRQLREAGVNRLSLGVQSSSEDELKLAGRPHSFAQAAHAVEQARNAGFENLSLDLIYGLPGQTMAHWQDSVEQVLSLCPEHLSCYGLKLEKGTPFWRQQDTLSFPDEDAQADAYLWLCQRMERAGFVHYEISNFGKPGRESRHNLKYWNLEDYLGLGPAAHSDLRGVRFGYARDLEGYIRGDYPLSERKKISPPERLEEYVMLGLRLGRGIDPQGYRQYGGDNWAAVEAEFQALQAHGLVELTAGHWHCTPQGFLVSNALIGAVLERVSYTGKA